MFNKPMIAIIPARAGSKGLQGKNMRQLGGKPLVQHTIDAAHASRRFESVIVTSDDNDVLSLAEQLGVIPLRRPTELASGTTPMTAVVSHVDEFCSKHGIPRGQAFALLQPTSPLRQAEDIVQCIEQFEGGHYASAVSICALEHPPQKALTIVNGLLNPLFGWDALHANRQELEKTYRQNGAIWVVTWEAFRAQHQFVVAPALPFIMDAANSIDIDTLADFRAAEILFAQRTQKDHI